MDVLNWKKQVIQLKYIVLIYEVYLIVKLTKQTCSRFDKLYTIICD